MSEEQKEEEKKEEEPPELVLRVDMHCEACARKVGRSLRKFLGVDDVKTDSKSRTVVIKGKEVDPAKVIERIQKKTGKKVELISPLPPPPPEEEKKEEPEAPQEEKQEEPPKPITVVLKVRMHCEKCAQVLEKRVKKIEGVETVVPDLANSQVTVTGFVDPEKLVENVYRRTRKQASIIPEEVKEEEEKKEEEPEKKEKNGEGEKQEEGKEEEEENIKYDMNKYENWPSEQEHYVPYAYTHQTFSDENPNACSVM